MTIGLPRALLYYKYKYLWEAFFKELGCDIISSPHTDRKIMEGGINLSIDECCLPTKIYMGHVKELIGKCDYVLVPRIVSFGKKEDVCVKLNAMYDIVKNTFSDINILDYNVDKPNGHTESKGFVEMGKILGNNYHKSLRAYKRAKKIQILKEEEVSDAQEKLLASHEDLLKVQKEAPKILIISHAYNIYDNMLGRPVTDMILKMGCIPIYADKFNKEKCEKEAKKISSCLYWKYNKELIGTIELYKDKVDGIILLTAFPCGPDSLVNEMVLRKSHGVPITNIILDELQGEAGLQTRIESFLDITRQKKLVSR